jgi:dihydroneopterin aldolase
MNWAGLNWDGLPAVTDPAGRPLDRMTLVGIGASGRHGVYEHERRDGQQFYVDVVLHLDTRPAAASDDLAGTVDYGSVAVAVAAVVRGEPVNLVETLANRLAAVCLADPRVMAADVTVHKPCAPVLERLDDIRLTVRRFRDDVLAVEGGAGDDDVGCFGASDDGGTTR